MENSSEFKVEKVREEEDVQIYKVEGEGVEVTFTNSSKTGRLYIDGKGSRKYRDQIIDAVIKQTNNVTIGRPSRVSLPIMVKITSDGHNVVVKMKDYIKEKLKDLHEFGYEDAEEDELKEQISYVLSKQDDKLNVLGHSVKADLVID